MKTDKQNLHHVLNVLGLDSAPRHGTNPDSAVFKLETLEVIHPAQPYLDSGWCWRLVEGMRDDFETPEANFPPAEPRHQLNHEQRKQWLDYVAPKLGRIEDVRTAVISTTHMTLDTSIALLNACEFWLTEDDAGYTIRINQLAEDIESMQSIIGDDRVLDNLYILRAHDYDYVRFDADANQVSGLNVWGW